MDKNIDYLGHLPEFYSEILEMREIGKAVDNEIRNIEQTNKKDLADAFIMTADEKSIEIWESEIGLKNQHGLSLSQRRARLVNRYTTKPPFTIRWLENQLKELLGTGFIGVERDDDVEILYIYYDLNAVAQFKESEAMIEKVLPLSMNYFKNIRGEKKLIGGVYVGSTMPMHLHIDITKA